MREIKIEKSDSGQRFDKFLKKYLREAPGSFVYKMLRKKNIKLNGKKAEGREILCEGDLATLYLSDETVEKFRGTKAEYAAVYPEGALRVIFENENFIFVNKEAGVLSQKAHPDDISLVEYLLGYLQKKGEWSPEDIFTPGVCNRLDRNTSGIVLAGKNLAAARRLSEMLRRREPDKYYLTIVQGRMTEKQVLKGYLQKDEGKNRVAVYDEPAPGRAAIETHYEPLCDNGAYTLLRVKLVTGKTHQIRAHLAGTGHPVLGDVKYGGKPYRKQRQQLLHAARVVFPEVKEYPEISKKSFCADLPDYFREIAEELFGQIEGMVI